MLGTWPTTRAVYIFGVVLILIGLVFISTGVPVVRLEIGWTEIIGGAVAASAGCVITVLGLFLARLEMLQEALDRLTITAAASPLVSEPDADAFVHAEPEPRRAASVIFPTVHPLAPAAQRERIEPAPAMQVQPEPALSVAPHDFQEPERPVVEPPESPVLAEGAPALVHAEEAEASHSPSVEPMVPPEPVKQRTGFLSSLLSKRTLPIPRWRERVSEPAPDSSRENAYAPLTDHIAVPVPLRRTVVDLSSGWDEDITEPEPVRPAQTESHRPAPEPALEPSFGEAAVVDSVVPEAPLPATTFRASAAEPPYLAPDESVAPPTAPLEPMHEERSADIHTLTPKSEPQTADPVVVGRYNAGAASYVMYSNGMIEVETEQGTHQFASMQELKAFIERRDTAARA